MTQQQVLEFTLNDERYCLDIEYVSEIVRRSEGEVQSMPNAPPHVLGVMDLRGETTTIVDVGGVLSLPKADGEVRDKIIVFNDAETQSENLGWAVDDVTRVTTIDTDEIEELEDESIEGLLNREDGFLIWTSPEAIATKAQLAV